MKDIEISLYSQEEITDALMREVREECIKDGRANLPSQADKKAMLNRLSEATSNIINEDAI